MENLKCYSRNFWKENKKRVILIAKIATGTAILGTMTYLVKENIRKTELLNFVGDIAIEYKDKYKKTVKLCESKDEFINSFISKLLREGNSEGARQMAYKRWN